MICQPVGFLDQVGSKRGEREVFLSAAQVMPAAFGIFSKNLFLFRYTVKHICLVDQQDFNFL